MIKVSCVVYLDGQYKKIGFKTDKTLTHAIEEICKQLNVSYDDISDVETYNMYDFEAWREEQNIRKDFRRNHNGTKEKRIHEERNSRTSYYIR